MKQEACRRNGCTGSMEEGYCNLCGHAPSFQELEAFPTRVTEAMSRPASVPAETFPREAQLRPVLPKQRAGQGALPFLRNSQAERFGADLVSLPALPSMDPEAAVLLSPQVPEHRRMCGKCDAPARREVGFCARCGARYSFVAVLQPGQVIAGQYEVKGPIAFGGLGWIYLAFDRLLSRYVVLKGLLNAQDTSAAAAAVAERQFLAAVKHPDIVDVYNFVQVSGEGFIVMEYVGGRTLKQIRQERGPLPPPEAITFILRILPALGYLHKRGLVLCDFKPENVMLDHECVKLIDLGAVRHLDDPHGDIYGTVGYSAPEAGEGPTVASDLFTIGRSLAVLLMNIGNFSTTHRYSLPDPAGTPVLAQYQSLHRLLEKATAYEASQRFKDSDEFGEQLEGVLREVLARQSGAPQPGISKAFGVDPLSLDAGDAVEPVAPDAYCLPSPTLDGADAASQLVSLALGTPDLKQRVAALEGACQQFPTSLEARFRLAATYLQSAELDKAHHLLQATAKQGTANWRFLWFVGRLQLLRQQHKEAGHTFDKVFSHLPGELAPKLALALSAELQGEFRVAGRMYDLVCRVDPTFVSAAFGLARCERRCADKHAAVAALQRIPSSSALYIRAQIEAARTLLQTDDSAPALQDVRAASAMTQALPLKEQDRLRLERDMLQAAMHQIPAKRKGKGAPELLMGQPVTERNLRSRLEVTLRRIARFAEGEERVRIVDQANRIRPRSFF